MKAGPLEGDARRGSAWNFVVLVVLGVRNFCFSKL